MKRLCLLQKSQKSSDVQKSPNPATKKGVASLYIVIFATLLFGVITVSFARIILSEASQSSDDDLSRSAYDAALAGVEDAKYYVNKYYNCIKTNSEDICNKDWGIFTEKYVLKNGAYDGTEQNDWNCDDGFPLWKRMGKPIGSNGRKEVLIQEGNNDQGEFTDQAYTCVLVSDVVPDYRGTLSADTRTKVIPLGIDRDGNNTSTSTNSNLSGVKKVRFSWYSDMNRGANDVDYRLSSNGKFDNKSNATIPPTMQLSFIKFSGTSTNIETTYHVENTSDNYSTMVFLPSGKTDTPEVYQVSNTTLKDAGNVEQGGNSLTHKPFEISCTKNAEFACSVEIELPEAMSNSDTAFLVASLPYGDAYTDFAVTLLGDNDRVIYLKGVQISVDSTGRTNQLVRRVESRLDPADLFFPYPQYALELNGGDDDSLKKNFWVTNNCWYSNPSKGEGGECDNNGEINSSTTVFPIF